MNFRQVLKFLSILLAIISLSFLVSIAIGFFYVSAIETHALSGWIASFSIVAVAAIICFFLGKEATDQLFKREALCIVGLGWISATFFGALPYWFIAPNMSFVDSIFESAAGFTTTGSSVIPDPQGLPHSLLFYRSLTQWIGGSGIVIFFVSILSTLGAGAKILFSQESSVQVADLDSGRIHKDISNIVTLYLGLTTACALSYYITGMDFFDAVCHSFTTLATGGFSTKNTSIAFFNSAAIEYTAILFMFVSATNFILLIRAFQGSVKNIFKDSEWLLFASFVIIFSTIIAAAFRSQYTYLPLENIIRASLFQVVSMVSSTGYVTFDYNPAAPVTHIFLMILIMIGGCSGSTAGGIKMIRVIAAAKTIFLHIEKAFRPRLVRTIAIDKKPLPVSVQSSVMTFIVMVMMLFFISLLLMAFLQPSISFEGLFSGIITCFSNVGPGLSEIGPTTTFNVISDPNKLILCLIMIIGRLELFAILVLFIPGFWRKFS